MAVRPQNRSHQPCHSPFHPRQPSRPRFIFHTHRLFPAPRRLRSRALLCAFITLCPNVCDAYLSPGTACVTPVAVVSADLRCWLQPCSPASVCACVRAHVCLQKEHFLCIVRRMLLFAVPALLLSFQSPTVDCWPLSSLTCVFLICAEASSDRSGLVGCLANDRSL